MVRITLLSVLLAVLAVGSGCDSSMPGPGGLATGPSGTGSTVAGEVDLVERVELSRQEYRQAMEALVDYYEKTGNNRNLGWARRELAEVRQMPKYSYTGNVVPGPDLKAETPLADADALFQEAEKTLQAGAPMYRANLILPMVKNEGKLHEALDQYLTVIRKFPASDKIDDAAFKVGLINELLKDYNAALIYYQRAYEWDKMTPYPARFKAAQILDKRLTRRGEALEIYQEALTAEGLRFGEWKQYAEKRVAELTKTPVEATSR